MRNKKNQRTLKVYTVIGKALCACAGGIVGFILGGPFVGLAGIFVGSLCGHLMETVALKSAA